MTTTADTEDIRIPVRDAVRTALIELLSTGEHPEVASAATLSAVAHARRDLTVLHANLNPAGPHAPDSARQAALLSALGDIGGALLATYHHRPSAARLRAGLTVLTTVALGWLDALPHPANGCGCDHDCDCPCHCHDDDSDALPF